MNWQIGPVVLPGDLEWSDELTWSPRRQSEEMSLAGTVILQRSTQVSGRPVTLATPQGVWVTRQNVLDLHAFYELPSTDSFIVQHPDGRELVCKFRTSGNESPIDAAPIQFLSPLVSTDPYTMTLRLMTA
jgi:hypothetical protein